MIRYYDGDGRLSLAVEHNGILYLTGRTCGDYPDIKGQTRGVLRIIDETLEKYNSDKEHILRAQIFLKDVLRDFDQMNEVWEEWVIKGKEPARATVQAEMAAEDRLIEIVVTATVKE